VNACVVICVVYDLHTVDACKSYFIILDPQTGVHLYVDVIGRASVLNSSLRKSAEGQ